MDIKINRIKMLLYPIAAFEWMKDTESKIVTSFSINTPIEVVATAPAIKLSIEKNPIPIPIESLGKVLEIAFDNATLMNVAPTFPKIRIIAIQKINVDSTNIANKT